ncbi:UVR domain-containing protein [Chloropicon primus]|nr:hypothetical protein A3770_01p09630 [Chloropicon primus]UPQ97655.1 UVR domain-containing protein [Chloropicon primus]|eukprot:QDZ18445.1 hypothetical protein A3770_01p09630 [Chloropicon primus]
MAGLGSSGTGLRATAGFDVVLRRDLRAGRRRRRGEAAGACRCQGGDEASVDEVGRLRSALEQAIEGEDYERAASVRDEIKRLTEADKVQIADANESFYRAFGNGSMTEMAQVWGHGDHCRVVHPGAGCIMGRDGVLTSWKHIFSVGGYDIKVDQVEIHSLAGGNSALVTCTESVDSGATMGKIIATNIFEKQKGEWKMVHHHGSSNEVLVENPWTI